MSIKPIIGEDAPISLIAKVSMDDVTIQSGGSYSRRLTPGNWLAVVAINGKGLWQDSEGSGDLLFKARDFSVVEAIEDTSISVRAESELRLAIIEVPSQVEYALYGE